MQDLALTIPYRSFYVSVLNSSLSSETHISVEIDFDELPSRIFNGMISVQVPTSLCMQNKLIMHSRYCFVEEYVHPRKWNIYMANLNLGMNKNGFHFPLPRAFSLPLSLLCPPLTRLLLFGPAFLYLSLRPVLFSDPAQLFLVLHVQ